MRQGRVLGIDAGERRVGVALSDELRMLASPLVVLDARQGLAPVLDELVSLAGREGVVEMVVGLPLNADGSRGPQARRAQDFARVASRVVGVPVSLWDERLSTREAEAIVRAQGRNPRRLRHRGEIDAIAAAVILQDFLDHSPPEGTRPRSSTSSSEPSTANAWPANAPPAGEIPPDGPPLGSSASPRNASPAAGHANREDGTPLGNQ